MEKEVLSRLKKLRTCNGLTQEKLAADLNISRSKVSNWETGRRYISVDDAIILGEYFDVSLDNLLCPKPINSDEYLQISRRFFNNKNIKYEEKNNMLKMIRDSFLLSNSEKIYPMMQSDT